jgi:DNA polymerase elongation subunit (family B)
LDYGHYIEKQIRPVAEPVLTLLGLDFSRVAGTEKQLSLF